MSKQRSKWKNGPDGKTVLRNNLAAFWHSRPVELMKSPALRCLSSSAHLALLRVEIELRQHAGKCNGDLVVTKEQFIEFGIHQDMVAPALREVEAVGIISIKHGRGGNAEHREPNRFTLNYLCGAEDEATKLDAWKRFQTLKEAKEAALAARKAKDPTKVAYSRRSSARKNISQAQKVCLGSDTQSVPETTNFPGTESVPPSQAQKVCLLSILSGGGGEAAGVSAEPPGQQQHLGSPSDAEQPATNGHAAVAAFPIVKDKADYQTQPLKSVPVPPLSDRQRKREWLRANPPFAAPGECAHCGEPPCAGEHFACVRTTGGGRAFVHHRCKRSFLKARDEQARAAVGGSR
jgi:hypothetical protein